MKTSDIVNVSKVALEELRPGFDLTKEELPILQEHAELVRNLVETCVGDPQEMLASLADMNAQVIGTIQSMRRDLEEDRLARFDAEITPEKRAQEIQASVTIACRTLLEAEMKAAMKQQSPSLGARLWNMFRNKESR